MTGLKSGSGDDLWGDDAEEEDESAESEPTDDRREETPESTPERESEGEPTFGRERAAADADADAAADAPRNDPAEGRSASDAHPYIVRRAIRDKSVQFERDERLTFFVHDDVVDGERNLLTRLESALGRDVPKFDVREAVYRAALRNPDDVLDELLDMGYTLDEDRE